MDDLKLFGENFRVLTGNIPFRWQERLFQEFVAGRIPAALDLPTGLGKTSVMAIWLIARALADDDARKKLPRRLVYVVDRRVVVDQATAEAEKIREQLAQSGLDCDKLGLGKSKLPISTLRGAYVGNREWLANPAATAIIVGTVNMIGSRLLFSGYGVSSKMRPYHAGLLGVDTLVVLDEAHLVPPFAHLLRAIELDAAFWPKKEIDREVLPQFAVLPLSATQRDSGELGDKRKRAPFRLKEEDWKPGTVVERRLNATKRLRLALLADKGQDKQLAEAAWALAMRNGEYSRVAVFCDRRSKKDDGSGPSTEGVKEEIENLAKGKKSGHPNAKIHDPQLLVGARRVHERDAVERNLRQLGFIGPKAELEKPAFLIATAAGEVGVDIDADHMVCDLAPWERMVQRLGRVNRRGEGDAEVRAFWRQPSVKNIDAPTAAEKRALIAFASKGVIERLDQIDGAFDASPGALRNLAERARDDRVLKASIETATTPEPLRPALSRALVDAWSMTSLENHAGRPDNIQPWLRGWDDGEESQTTVVWRAHLPVRIRDDRPVAKSEIDAFFDAAPPHISEMLATETWRVSAWLFQRVAALAAEINKLERTGQPGSIDMDSDVLFVLNARNELDSDSRWTLRRLAELEDKAKDREKKAFDDSLKGRTLVIAAALGGLSDGMLRNDEAAMPSTMDTDESWRERPFRVRETDYPKATSKPGWKASYRFARAVDGDGEATRWLVIDERSGETESEDTRAISPRLQLLKDHREAVEAIIRDFASALSLPPDYVDMLGLSARHHDEGKAFWRWRLAFGVPPHGEAYAKTAKFVRSLLDGYRHEFGSLLKLTENPELDLRDPLLHIVAAHHGNARPLIPIRNAEGAVSDHQACALEATLRFARLQERWGPWGLAWWEALLRAADQKASRENDLSDAAKNRNVETGEVA